VAITAAKPAISSGEISGVGSAIAKTIASGAIRRIPAGVTAPGWERPM
jgi:hypothetical protein